MIERCLDREECTTKSVFNFQERINEFYDIRDIHNGRIRLGRNDFMKIGVTPYGLFRRINEAAGIDVRDFTDSLGDFSYENVRECLNPWDMPLSLKLASVGVAVGSISALAYCQISNTILLGIEGIAIGIGYTRFLEITKEYIKRNKESIPDEVQKRRKNFISFYLEFRYS